MADGILPLTDDQHVKVLSALYAAADPALVDTYLQSLSTASRNKWLVHIYRAKNEAGRQAAAILQGRIIG